MGFMTGLARILLLDKADWVEMLTHKCRRSALLDSQGKLEKIVRGMNAVSGDIPITVKIRMGTKDNKPSALKLVDRLVYGGEEALEATGMPCGMSKFRIFPPLIG